MANFVLDVTRVPNAAPANPDVTGAVSAYRFCSQGVTNLEADTSPIEGGLTLGVIMDSLDADKLAEGGSVSVRVLGIAPVRVGAVDINTAGTRVSTDTSGRAVASATTASSYVAGILMQAGSAGSIVDVLLTPGAKFASA